MLQLLQMYHHSNLVLLQDYRRHHLAQHIPVQQLVLYGIRPIPHII